MVLEVQRRYGAVQEGVFLPAPGLLLVRGGILLLCSCGSRVRLVGVAYIQGTCARSHLPLDICISQGPGCAMGPSSRVFLCTLGMHATMRRLDTAHGNHE